MVDDVELRNHEIIVQTPFDTHLHQSMTPITPNHGKKSKTEKKKKKKKTN